MKKISIFYLIKPDAIKHEDKINDLLNSYFSVERYARVKLSDEDVLKIYANMVSHDAFNGLVEYMSESESGFGILKDASIERLISISGSKIDPIDCEEGTIRRLYGAGISLTRSGFVVIKNAIHRPKSHDQNDYTMDFLLSLLK